jgi:hypothetical protein
MCRENIKKVTQLINNSDSTIVALGFSLSRINSTPVNLKQHKRMWLWLQKNGHNASLTVCDSLEDMVLEMLKIKQITILRGTNVPKYIYLFRNLELLDLKYCVKMAKIPLTIKKLKYLKELRALSCKKVTNENFELIEKTIPNVKCCFPYKYLKYSLDKKTNTEL